jgi:aminopeptidase N
MNVVSLNYHGTTYSTVANIDHIVDTVVINLPAPIVTSGTLDSVTINYNGTPPQSGSSRGYKRSTTASYPALDFTMLSTHSSGYFARQWWPCKHVLGDKIDSVDIIVTAPSANLVVSNGLLQTPAPPIVGGNKTWWWKTRYKVAHYLIAIAVYPYVIYNSQQPLMAQRFPLSVILQMVPIANGRTSWNENVMEYFSTIYAITLLK